MSSQPPPSAPPSRASIFSLVASLNPGANASVTPNVAAGGPAGPAGMSPQSAPPLIHMMHRQFQGDTRAMPPSITGPRASLQATGTDSSMLSRLASVVATSPALQSSVPPRSAMQRSAFSLLNFPASSTPGGRADLISFPHSVSVKSEPAASSPGLPPRVTAQPKRPFEQPQSTSPSYLLQSARPTPALSLLRPPIVGAVGGPASVSGEGSVAQRYQQRVQELLQNQTSSTSGQLRVPTSPLQGFNSTFSPQLPLPSQIHNTDASVPSLAPPASAAPLSTGIELNAQHLALLQMQMQMQIQLQMQAQAAAAASSSQPQRKPPKSKARAAPALAPEVDSQNEEEEDSELRPAKKRNMFSSLPCGKCCLMTCSQCLHRTPAGAASTTSQPAFCHPRESNRLICIPCCRQDKCITISAERVLLSYSLGTPVSPNSSADFIASVPTDWRRVRLECTANDVTMTKARLNVHLRRLLAGRAQRSAASPPSGPLSQTPIPGLLQPPSSVGSFVANASPFAFLASPPFGQSNAPPQSSPPANPASGSGGDSARRPRVPFASQAAAQFAAATQDVKSEVKKESSESVASSTTDALPAQLSDAVDDEEEQLRSMLHETDLASTNLPSWLSSLSIFSAFYTEFGGSARSFELFDAHDSSLWPCPLPFDRIFVFLTPVHAAAAMRLFPDRFARVPMPVFTPSLQAQISPSTSGTAAPVVPTCSATGVTSHIDLSAFNCTTIMLNICTQCNMYIPRYPLNRINLPAYFISSSAMRRFASMPLNLPNFYTDNMCRKNTNSHRKRYRSDDRARFPVSVDLALAREIWFAFVAQSKEIDRQQALTLGLPARPSPRI